MKGRRPNPVRSRAVARARRAHPGAWRRAPAKAKRTRMTTPSVGLASSKSRSYRPKKRTSVATHSTSGSHYAGSKAPLWQDVQRDPLDVLVEQVRSGNLIEALGMFRKKESKSVIDRVSEKIPYWRDLSSKEKKLVVGTAVVSTLPLRYKAAKAALGKVRERYKKRKAEKGGGPVGELGHAIHAVTPTGDVLPHYRQLALGASYEKEGNLMESTTNAPVAEQATEERSVSSWLIDSVKNGLSADEAIGVIFEQDDEPKKKGPSPWRQGAMSLLWKPRKKAHQAATAKERERGEQKAAAAFTKGLSYGAGGLALGAAVAKGIGAVKRQRKERTHRYQVLSRTVPLLKAPEKGWEHYPVPSPSPFPYKLGGGGHPMHPHSNPHAWNEDKEMSTRDRLIHEMSVDRFLKALKERKIQEGMTGPRAKGAGDQAKAARTKSRGIMDILKKLQSPLPAAEAGA